ncbi:tetratricopeptide repeat protein [Streptomyces sp. NPDC020490]|uniref:tetratricopeptide repeat protein n=1 Tax=Streptomyces sp. NPDC020490 TaxID=3365078 RepID=UPI0037BDDBC6
MTRLSREKKRDTQRAAAPSAALVAPPIDVRVSDAGAASVDGVPVSAPAGEEIQNAVLNHLHRLALAAGHPVHATVHDERIGYVVHLEVGPDGSSGFTGEPVRMPEPDGAAVRPAGEPRPAPERTRPEHGQSDLARQPEGPRRGTPEYVVRAAAEPVRDAVPTFPLRAVPEPQQPGGNARTFALRAVPEPSGAAHDLASGTVASPTGEFGPPPLMDAVPPQAERGPEDGPEHEPERGRERVAQVRSGPVPTARPQPPAASKPLLIPVEPEPEPRPTPTPARGFDAVAEAVLDDRPPAVPTPLTEPMARIGEAVRSGRTDVAAELAQQTIADASTTLGTEHPEVLRLRELTAYVAYLAGDPVRSFRLSLALVRIFRTRDAEAAYGNIQSAATAWRAVRDPEQGLALGRDLIGLWTELAAEGGPAADDIERLESARARMGRLTARARRDAEPSAR